VHHDLSSSISIWICGLWAVSIPIRVHVTYQLHLHWHRGRLLLCLHAADCEVKRRMGVEGPGTISGEVGVLMDDNDYKAKDAEGLRTDVPML